MKRIVNHKLYNTETAELIGSYDNGYYGDARFCEEELYRKRTGEYFLHGTGGALSRYARSRGDHTTGGEDVIPLPADAARTWSEEHLSPEDYEKHFGAIVEDESRCSITMTLKTTNRERLRRAASEQGVTVSTVIDRLIEEMTCSPC